MHAKPANAPCKENNSPPMIERPVQHHPSRKYFS
jgi:hypothetical protein